MPEYKITATEPGPGPKTYRIVTGKRESAKRYTLALAAQGMEVKVEVGGKVFGADELGALP